MKLGPHLKFGAVAAAVLVTLGSAVAVSAKAPEKAFTFSTQSKEAHDDVLQAITGIESFRFGEPVLSLVQKAAAADPNFAFAEYLVGTLSASPEEAKPHIDKAVELAKTASEGERRYIEAVILVRSGQADKGVPILVELSQQYPGERMVRMMLGQAYLNVGKIDDAKLQFEKALQLDSSTPRVYAFLGNVYLLKDDYGKARELFKKSLAKTDPTTAPFPPNYGLAYSYIYEGKYDDAIKILTAYQAQYTKVGGFPNLPAVFIWNSMARLYLESNRPEEAIKYYQKGYDTVPNSSMTDVDKQIWLGRLHHGTGRSLSRMGKPDEAWKEAETIKQMIENGGDRGKEFLPSYHYIAGYLKYEAGDYQAAIEHMKQADIKDDDFRKLVLARSYDKVGDTADAQKLYKEIVDSKTINIERAIAYPEAKKKLKS